jgi:hypothetical protein
MSARLTERSLATRGLLVGRGAVALALGEAAIDQLEPFAVGIDTAQLVDRDETAAAGAARHAAILDPGCLWPPRPRQVGRDDMIGVGRRIGRARRLDGRLRRRGDDADAGASRSANGGARYRKAKERAADHTGAYADPRPTERAVGG